MKQKPKKKVETGTRKIGTTPAWSMSKAALERRRKYLYDHQSKLYYLERSIKGDQYA